MYGREVVRRVAVRALLAVVGVVVVTAALGLPLGFQSIAAPSPSSPAIGAILVLDRQVTPVLDRQIRGNDGERHLGCILDSLHSAGWLSLHDVSTGRGNGDHFVVGPRGVFTIDTTSHGGGLRV
jgi:Nuclease-related domain